MFSTKQRVDKHVANILGRIKDEKEKHAKGYQIAKMYFDVKEYEMARRYLSMFLGVKERFAMAHKLMGEILEAQGATEGALQAYRRCHQLDDKQKDVVIKICELYCQMDIDMERARYWAEKAEKIDPKHSVVYRLRERIYTSTDADPCPKDLEVLITDELVKRPHDASLRMRLLRLYIDQERTNEAYDHVIEIEKRRPYHQNLEWYQTVVEVLEVYQEESGASANGSFHYHLLQALCTIASLSLAKSLSNATDALNKFDAGLLSASKQTNQAGEWPEFLAEMRAEYFHLAGTLLLKRCMKEKHDWSKSSRLAAACFLASYCKDEPETQAPWFAAASKDSQQSFQHWCDNAAYRLSQTGHVLSNMARDHGQAWLGNVKNELCTTQGCQLLHDQLYAGLGVKNRKQQAFLLQNPACFTSFSIRLPTMDQLRIYDDVSHRLRPGDLGHLVWIALQYNEPKQIQPDYHFHVFDALQPSTKAVDTCAPESLCRLDVDAFIYATVHNTGRLRQQRQKLLRKGSVQYEHLPYVLSENLCSDAQARWWTAAHKLYMNKAKENLTSLRQTLLRGLEVVRVMGNHGLNARLVLELARIFQQRESEILGRSADPLDYACEAEQFRTRAKLYWTRALDMITKTGRKLSTRQPKDLLFPPLGEELTPIEIKDYKRDANFYLSCDLMKSGEHGKAIEAFDQLVLPYASYYQAKIYAQLSEDEFGNRSLSEMRPDHKEQYLALLDKAKEAYYTTLDRLRNDKHHVLHQILATDITEIENLISTVKGEHQDDPWPNQHQNGCTPSSADLSRIPLDVTTPVLNPHACSTPYRPSSRPGSLMNSAVNSPAMNLMNSPAVNRTLNNSVNTSMTNGTLNGGMNSISPEKPRRIPPSPERLEAQIRSLQQSQELIVTSVKDSIRELMATNKTMQQEMKDFKTTMDQIKGKLEELAVRQMTPVQPPPPQYNPAAQFPPHYAAGMPPQAFYPDYMKYGQYMPQAGYPAISALQNLAQVSTPQQSEPRPPTHGFETDFDDEEFFQEDDYLEQNYGKDRYNVADNELIQEWPYGSITEVKGSSTVTYQPQQQQQAGAALPGPGFFARAEDARIAQKPGLLGHSPHAPAQPPACAATAQGAFRFGMVPGALKPEAVKSTPNATPTPAKDEKVELNKSVQDRTQESVDGADDSYDPHFAPVIALPEKVEMLTGEEEETVLYEIGKAKLYRFDDGQWKERGRGPVKLLQNKDKRVRFVMRREQVLKICANHYLDKNMILEVNTKVGKNTALWFAADFAEDEMKNEKFCLRFQNEEQMREFEKAFKNALVMLAGVATPIDAIKLTTPPKFEEKKVEVKEPPRPSITAGFIKPAPTPIAAEPEKTEAGPSPFAGFSFGMAGAKSSFGVKADAASPAMPLFGGAVAGAVEPAKPAFGSAEPSKPFSGFGAKPLGQTENTSKSLFSTPDPAPKSIFGQSPAFGQTPSFGSAAPSSIASKTIFGQASGTTGMSSFSSLASKGDSFQTASPGKGLPFAPGSPMLNAGKSPKSPGGGDDPHAYEAQPDFKPLIELPELVKFTSGEEDETKLFGERGKMFRHDPESKSWKERGVGEMKIMKDTKTGRCRILMRREQVHKLCANHAIIESMNLIKMGTSAKAWCWTAHDFSDPDDPTTEQFAIKFKNEDMAANFKEVFEECQKNRPKSLENSPVKEIKPSGPQSKSSIADRFKLKSNEWDCDQCFSRNKEENRKCVACEALKPALKQRQAAAAPMPKSVVNPKTDQKSAAIFDKFKKKDDEWECNSCLCRNKISDVNCLVCQSRNPDAPAEEKPKDGSSQFGSSAPGGGFKFGSSGAGGFSSGFGGGSAGGIGAGFAGGASKTSPSSSSGIFGTPSTGFKVDTAGPKVEGGFSFGASTAKTTETPKSGFQFGVTPASSEPAKSSLSFGQNTTTPNAPALGATKSGFSFGASTATPANEPTKTGFSFGQASAIKTESSFSLAQSSFGQPKQSTPAEAKPVTESKPAFSLGTPGTPNASAFSFGAQNDTKTKTPEKSSFAFGTPGTLNTAFQFSTPAASSNLNEKFSTSTPMASPQVSKPPTTPATLPAALAGGFKFGDQSTTFAFSGVTPSKADTSYPAQAKSPLTPKSPDDHYHQEEDDSHIYFEPIVPLPDKVEIKSGEEDEEEKFSHRAKLYRFVNKEWKERGLGVVKILEHKESKKLRIVMRREQVKKLCLNHMITADMDLTPMKGGKGAAWVWSAMDFAEGESTPEQFCIKFKTPEIASDFKAAFESKSDAADKSGAADKSADFSFKLDDADISDTKVPDTFTFQSPNTSAAASPGGFSFGDRFRASPTAGKVSSPFGLKASSATDSDDDCVITHVEMPSAEDVALAREYRLPETFYNYKTRPDCPGCAGCTDTMPTYKYGEDDDVRITSVLSASPASVDRARKLQLPDNFYLYEKQEPCKGCRGCSECEGKVGTSAPSSSAPGRPLFGAAAPAFGASSSTPSFGSAAAGGPIFGAGGSGFGTFADLATVPVAGFAGKDSDKPFSWTGAGQTLFGEGGEAGGDDSVATDDPHYEAVIPLPELVEVSTGEENEDCIWSHRCKLYRYDSASKAWKERAIGDIKVLKHKECARFRLVMRREQVKKMALNHVLGLELDLQPMKTSETAWCWYAQDYADPTQGQDYEQFAVKFKNKDIATAFRDKFVECQAMLREEAEKEDEQADNAEPDSTTDDIPEVVPFTALNQLQVKKEEVADEEEEEEDEEAEADEAEDEDYEDVQDEEPLFDKRVSLSRKIANQPQPVAMGSLIVYEADYGYGTKVSMDADDGTNVADHYIVQETKLHVDKKKRTAEWNALDFSQNKVGTQTLYTAQFSSASSLLEFEEVMKQCIESAQEMAFSERDLVTDIQEIDEPEVVGRIHEEGEEETD